MSAQPGAPAAASFHESIEELNALLTATGPKPNRAEQDESLVLLHPDYEAETERGNLRALSYARRRVPLLVDLAVGRLAIIEEHRHALWKSQQQQWCQRRQQRQEAGLSGEAAAACLPPVPLPSHTVLASPSSSSPDGEAQSQRTPTGGSGECAAVAPSSPFSAHPPPLSHAPPPPPAAFTPQQATALADIAVTLLCGRTACGREGSADAQVATAGRVWNSSVARYFFSHYRDEVNRICAALSEACERLERVVPAAMTAPLPHLAAANRCAGHENCSTDDGGTCDSQGSRDGEVAGGGGSAEDSLPLPLSWGATAAAPVTSPTQGSSGAPLPAAARGEDDTGQTLPSTAVGSAAVAASAEESARRPPPLLAQLPAFDAAEVRESCQQRVPLTLLPSYLSHQCGMIQNSLLMLESLLVAVAMEDQLLCLRVPQPAAGTLTCTRGVSCESLGMDYDPFAADAPQGATEDGFMQRPSSAPVDTVPRLAGAAVATPTTHDDTSVASAAEEPLKFVVERATQSFMKVFLSITTIQNQLIKYGHAQDHHHRRHGSQPSAATPEPDEAAVHSSTNGSQGPVPAHLSSRCVGGAVHCAMCQRFDAVHEALSNHVEATMRVLKLTTIALVAHDTDIAEAAINYMDSQDAVFTAQATMLLAHVLTPELLAAHPTNSRGGKALKWILGFVFGGCDSADVVRTQQQRQMLRADSNPFSIADSSTGSAKSRDIAGNGDDGDDLLVGGARAGEEEQESQAVTSAHAAAGKASNNSANTDDAFLDRGENESDFSFASSSDSSLSDGNGSNRAGKKGNGPEALTNTYSGICLRVEYVLGACFTQCYPLMTVVGTIAESNAYDCGTVVAKAVLQYAVTLSHTSARLLRTPLLSSRWSTPFTEAMMRGLNELAKLTQGESELLGSPASSYSSGWTSTSADSASDHEDGDLVDEDEGPEGQEAHEHGELSAAASASNTPMLGHASARATPTDAVVPLEVTDPASDVGVRPPPHHRQRRRGHTGATASRRGNRGEQRDRHRHHKCSTKSVGGEAERASVLERAVKSINAFLHSHGDASSGSVTPAHSSTTASFALPSHAHLPPLTRVYMEKRRHRFRPRPRGAVTGTTPADRAETSRNRTFRRTVALQWAKCVILSARTLIQAGITRVPIPREHYDTLYHQSKRLQGMLSEWFDRESALLEGKTLPPDAAPEYLESANPFSMLECKNSLSSSQHVPHEATAADRKQHSSTASAKKVLRSLINERYERAFADSFCRGRDAVDLLNDCPYVDVPVHEVLFASFYTIFDALADVVLCEEPRLNTIFINEIVTLLYEVRLSMLEARTHVELITSHATRFRSLSERDAMLYDQHLSPFELLFPAEYGVLMERAFRCEEVITRWRRELSQDPNHPATGFASLLHHLHRKLIRYEHPTNQELLISRATLRLLLGVTARDECGDIHGDILHVDDLDVEGTKKEDIAPRLGVTASMDSIRGSRDDLQQLITKQNISVGVYRTPSQSHRNSAVATPIASDDDEAALGAGGGAIGLGGGRDSLASSVSSTDSSSGSSSSSSSNSSSRGGRMNDDAGAAVCEPDGAEAQRDPLTNDRKLSAEAAVPSKNWMHRINDGSSNFYADSLSASPLQGPCGTAPSFPQAMEHDDELQQQQQEQPLESREDCRDDANPAVRAVVVNDSAASGKEGEGGANDAADTAIRVGGGGGAGREATLPAGCGEGGAAQTVSSYPSENHPEDPSDTTKLPSLRADEGHQHQQAHCPENDAATQHQHHHHHHYHHRDHFEPEKRPHSIKVIGNAEDMFVMAQRAPATWGIPSASEILRRADRHQLAKEPALVHVIEKVHTAEELAQREKARDKALSTASTTATRSKVCVPPSQTAEAHNEESPQTSPVMNNTEIERLRDLAAGGTGRSRTTTPVTGAPPGPLPGKRDETLYILQIFLPRAPIPESSLPALTRSPTASSLTVEEAGQQQEHQEQQQGAPCEPRPPVLPSSRDVPPPSLEVSSSSSSSSSSDEDAVPPDDVLGAHEMVEATLEEARTDVVFATAATDPPTAEVAKTPLAPSHPPPLPPSYSGTTPAAAATAAASVSATSTSSLPKGAGKGAHTAPAEDDETEWNLRRFDPNRPAGWAPPPGNLPAVKRRHGLSLSVLSNPKYPTNTSNGSSKSNSMMASPKNANVASGAAGQYPFDRHDGAMYGKNLRSGGGSRGSMGALDESYNAEFVLRDDRPLPVERRTLVPSPVTTAMASLLPQAAVADTRVSGPPVRNTSFDLSRMPNARRLLETMDSNAPAKSKNFTFLSDQKALQQHPTSDEEEKEATAAATWGGVPSELLHSPHAQHAAAADRKGEEADRDGSSTLYHQQSHRDDNGGDDGKDDSDGDDNVTGDADDLYGRHGSRYRPPPPPPPGHGSDPLSADVASISHRPGGRMRKSTSPTGSPGGADSDDSGERVPVSTKTATAAASIVRDFELERRSTKGHEGFFAEPLPPVRTSPAALPAAQASHASKTPDGGGAEGKTEGSISAEEADLASAERSGERKETEQPPKHPSYASAMTDSSDEVSAAYLHRQPGAGPLTTSGPTLAGDFTTEDGDSAGAGRARRDSSPHLPGYSSSGSTPPAFGGPSPLRTLFASASERLLNGVAAAFGRHPPSSCVPPSSPAISLDSTGSPVSPLPTAASGAPPEPCEGDFAPPPPLSPNTEVAATPATATPTSTVTAAAAEVSPQETGGALPVEKAPPHPTSESDPARVVPLTSERLSAQQLQQLPPSAVLEGKAAHSGKHVQFAMTPPNPPPQQNPPPRGEDGSHRGALPHRSAAGSTASHASSDNLSDLST